MKRLLLFCVSVIFANGAKLPDSFKKCNRKDPNFKECLVEAARMNIPQMTKPFKQIRLPSMDPLEVPTLTIQSGSGPVSVDQFFTNCKVYGLNDIQIEKFVIDLDNKVCEFAGSVPQVRKLCDYKLDGSILLFPVKGEGPSEITLNNLKVYIRYEYDEVAKNGKTYMTFKPGQFTMDPDLVTFQFDNLFNGDKAMSDNIHKVLNDNWQDMFNDVKGSYEEAFMQIILSVINGLFSKVSIEESFD